MKVRPAEMIAGEPLRHDAVQTRLCRVAAQDGLLVAVRGDRAPLDLIRQLEDDGLRIELGRGGHYRHAGQDYRGECGRQDSLTTIHVFLPISVFELRYNKCCRTQASRPAPWPFGGSVIKRAPR